MNEFEGQFFTRGDDGFEEAAVGRIFNGRRPAAEVRRPTAVLYAESVEDVQRG
ncbi:MAG: hypothetical protein RL418_88, partial [Actinomycetota bacterium]